MSGWRTTWFVLKLTYRFWTGRPMSGERKTNATFRRAATHSLDPSGTALRWEMLAGWQRLVWRLAGSYLLLLSLSVGVLSLADLSLGRRILSWHLGILLSVFLFRALRRRVLLHGYRLPVPARTEDLSWGIRWVVTEGRLGWERETVLPLARALQSQLQISWTEKEQRRHVSVPRDYREDGGGSVEILLPAKFSGADTGAQARLVRTAAARLGMRDPVATWQLEGSVPRVLIALPPAPPKLITFSEVRHFFEAAEPFKPFYGVIAGGEGLHIGMHSDSPHIALSAGSGAGKSEMIKNLMMQALHWGWSVIVLDWKNESQEWGKGLPGVRYFSTEEGIHDALVSLGEEIDWRKAHGGGAESPVMVICEEWSMTADLLQEYWTLLRASMEPEERRTTPMRSPALTAAKKIVFTGRSLGIFQMLVAIRFSARVTGGNADLREAFQVILMARFKAQTVKMLAPGINPFPKNKPKEVGRWVVVMGEDVVTMRAPLTSDDEAILWATSGVQPPASPYLERWGNGGNAASTLGESVTPGVARGNQRDLPVIEGEEVQICPRKLSALAEALGGTVSLKVLQNAAGDPNSGFPAPVGGTPNQGYTYDLESVKIWTRKRNATREITARYRNGRS